MSILESKFSGLSLSESNEIIKLSSIIIDNLDDGALMQLTSGSEKDIFKLLNNVYEDTYQVLTNPEAVHKTTVTPQYLDKLSSNIEETLRIENFLYFILTTLPTFEIGPHHIEWCNYVKMYKWLGLVASRGLGKSFWASKAYPIWKMYRYRRPRPLERIKRSIDLSHKGILFTHEIGLGEELMSDIKDEIESNDILRDKLLPRSSIEGWSKRSITCKNGAKFQIKSYGSKARGRHPGYIVVDDFLSENVLYSKEQNDKVISYFHSVIMNMILEQGQVLIIGTPFSTVDLYADLKSKKTWKMFEYPAIFPDGTLAWPAKYSYDAILEKKESQGNLTFSREILCKPITNDSTIFPYDVLAKCFIPTVSLVHNKFNFNQIKLKKIVSGWDLSKSANIGADYTVGITLGIDEFDNYWILNIYREKGKSYGEQIAKIKALHANFQYDVIFIEDNGFQKIYVEELVKAGLPVVGDTTSVNKYSFEDGLPKMAVLFEHGRIRIPRGDEFSINQTDILVSELSSIAFTSKGLKGVGEHDDTGMALWKAVRAASYKSDFDFSIM